MTEMLLIQIDKAELTAIVERAVESRISKLAAKDTPPRKVRSLRELAKYLKISVNKVQRLKNEGKIPFYQDGRVVIFDLDQVDQAVRGFNQSKD